ncbi:acetyl-CoA C-acetyltransferase [Peribacillus deserti]|uniref:acetyl-CoA C-acetyltransferase n=1 Tax=Peribacillus deserti TaxID=673318 RepID=A0ABS2QER0_9BACI|nr:thiolase family protein [Peribacillus deserti]MBM7691189.1 acetyl-CoA C-acetyltransferase [Peribacillus deserti]
MVVIVSARRTAIGRYGGALAECKPEDLLAVVMKNALSTAGCSSSIVDEVIAGQTKQSAEAPNIARVAALKAGFPETVIGHTVQTQCGSGLQAVINGAMSIRTGQSELILAGGVECMSQAPFYFTGNRMGIKPGDLTLYDSNTRSQPCSQPQDMYGSFSMGQTAEWLAEKFSISRAEQDEFALCSQDKAFKAIESGRFAEEIVPVIVPKGKRESERFAVDEHPRKTSLEKLSQLAPAFTSGGTVTAGNASGRNDGAAALLMMSEEKARNLGLTPLAKIRSWAGAGVSPKEMGLGPVPAAEKALIKAGLKMNDIDLVEINEAFSAQVLACLRHWPELDRNKINVNGGGIALGHPLGCSGARILVTLIHELHKTKLTYGLAALCAAGGLGIAMVVERWKEE